MADRIPARLTPAEGRKFAFTVGAAFFVLGAFVWWRGHLTLATAFGALAGTLVVLGIAVPGHLSGLNRAWPTHLSTPWQCLLLPAPVPLALQRRCRSWLVSAAAQRTVC